ncbi:MAG: sugar ABC transporter ATP-binding protein [Planctomycetes bacterium]|nr:sugar ABC transporter ATP-binding protein [Planctomycetota bacterium]
MQPPSDPDAPALLAMTGIEKSFPGVRALRGASFDLRAGEVHALLGENGAGKSTLIRILGGVLRPDAGEIRILGEPVDVRDVETATRLGIRLIHQELSLAPNLTVAENIFLGDEPGGAIWVDRRRMEREAAALLARLRFPLAPRARVGALRMVERQLVEIARALSRRARILVMDEPTSSLGDREVEVLFDAIRRLRAEGVGIIYISHRIDELFRIAERVTVLRDGATVATRHLAGASAEDLVRSMIGREAGALYRRPDWAPGDILLTARGIRAARLGPIDIDLRAGEILGIAGLIGAGRTELARAIAGADRVDAGEVVLAGKPVRTGRVADALAAGIALVPEDRAGQGLIPIQTVGFNLAIPVIERFVRGARIRRASRSAFIADVIRAYGIRARSPEQAVRTLSGGNQQKVSLGKWAGPRPRVLILDEPTRGIDIAAKGEIFDLVASLARDGAGIVFISSELPEVLAWSHRIAVLRNGRCLATLDAAAATIQRVLALCAGGEAA